MSIWLVLAAIILLCCSGIPACLLPARSKGGQRITTLLTLIGSAIGLWGVATAFDPDPPPVLDVPWVLPWGSFALVIDAIGAVFLVPVFIVPALGSIYGLEYWDQSRHPQNGRRLGLFFGLLTGSMALVVISRDGVLFLIAWEVMAIAAYFASTVEEEEREVRQAGWIYLVATHVGTLCLIAMFALWRKATGSFALEQGIGIAEDSAGPIFLLAVAGFGFKAGLMPLHVWLPGAHANAPSHVSAVMSGVMLKMGVYGIVRMTALLPTPPEWWGGMLLGMGAFSCVAGMAFAIGQQDLKRLLAYSSIENIGIITLGIGLALLGRSLGRPDWLILGLCGALLHVWNHGLFKGLLFLNAGAIIHAAHTRDLNRLGGLARRMPRVMALFLVGAVAICALPPLNGFVSEWLLYAGLFRTLDAGLNAGLPVAALAAVALAMTGALAVACFVKVLGSVFLGTARCENTGEACEPSASMALPMAVLAIGCAAIGLFPAVATPLLERAAHGWAALPPATHPLATLVSLDWIALPSLMLIGMIGAVLLLLHFLPRVRQQAEAGTWDCGYVQPSARMQYTATSFGQMLVGMFTFLLWPKNRWPVLRELFSRNGHFKSVVPDAVLDRLMLPLLKETGRWIVKLRVLQQGQTQLYILYILVVMLVLLYWGR